MFCFSRERPLLARGKILYFATIMDTNRDLAHQSQNEDNFAIFSLVLEFLNEAEKREKQRKFCLIFHLPRTITSDIVVATDLMHNSTGYVIKQLVHVVSCALSSYGALGKFGEHSRS